MFNDGDIAFAKVVTDPLGRDKILIGGVVIEIAASHDNNNEIVDMLVRALRNSAGHRVSAESCSTVG